MRNSHRKPARFGLPELPAGLFEGILARIREEERFLSLRKRLFLFSITILGSVTALIPAVNMFRAEFMQSGFAQFLSLFFSDGEFVVAHWQDFGLALLESFPAMTMITVLAAVLVFLWSLKRFAQIMGAVLNQPQFH